MSSLFRCSLASATAAASASSSAAATRSAGLLSTASLLAVLPVAGPSRPSSSFRTFSSSLPAAYPRAPLPRPARQASAAPADPQPTTTTHFAPEPEPAVDELAAASEAEAAPPVHAPLPFELPAERTAEDEHAVDQLLSRNKTQKYNKTHIFVRYLPHGVTNADLKSTLTEAGVPITVARILAYPRSDGRFVSRGYGWATLEREEDMRTALRLNGLRINGIPIAIEQMRQRPHGSFDRPPKPSPVQEPGYDLRLVPRSHQQRRELVARAGGGYGLVGAGPKVYKKSAARNNKAVGPKPGARESDVDWTGWEGKRRGLEQAEYVPRALAAPPAA